MRGAYLDNTVRRCIGSVNGLVGFAGATAQDVGRFEAGGRKLELGLVLVRGKSVPISAPAS